MERGLFEVGLVTIISWLDSSTDSSLNSRVVFGIFFQDYFEVM